MEPERPAGARRQPRPHLPRPGRHLRPRGRGAAVPARRRAAGHLRRRVGGRRGGRRCSGSARSRRSSTTSTRREGDDRRAPCTQGIIPWRADRQLGALPPRRHGHPARQRRPRPRRRRRPDPRRGRHLPGARGQRPGAVAASATSSPTAGRWPTSSPRPSPRMRIRPVHDYPRMLLSALRAAAPDGAERPDRRRAHPRRLQLRLLRARPARPDDGRRARRGPRPRLLRRRRSGCARPRASSRSTSSTAASTTSSSTRCTSARDSMLGVAGLVAAMRTGRVTVANAIGNGVADDKLIYTYLPDLIRYYLDEDPILPNVDTFRCNEPDALAHVLDRLDEMVVKPVDGSGGKGLVIGPAAPTAPPSTRLRERLDRRPARLDRPAGRPAVHGADPHRRRGSRPRHVDLRPFAVNDGDDGPGAARRADPRRPPRGRARRQLQPGRRLQGHLGALPTARARGQPPARPPGRPRGRRHEPPRTPRSRTRSRQQQQQQQQQQHARRAGHATRSGPRPRTG